LRSKAPERKKRTLRPVRVLRKPDHPVGEDLDKAYVTGGYNNPKISAEIEKKFGIPVPFLTERQWTEIENASGLPVHARFEINIALKRYWYSHLTQKVSPATVPEIKAVVQLLENVGLRLATLAENEDLFKGQIIHFDRSAIDQRENLEGTCASIFNAIGILSNSLSRLKRRRGNPSFGPLYELIHHLDFVLYKCLGEKLENSKKRIPSLSTVGTHQSFVWKVVEVANLKVSSSTVDTVLKNYCNDRDRRRREYGPNPV
jgi:hypothetical protein